MRVSTILATNVVDGTVFAYAYDDIGNRLWSREFGTNTIYAANGLNQYTEIVRGGVAERPAFDADGNQTDIVTGTGRWHVKYNGENRPVRWTRPADGTTLVMAYDSRGRRVRSNTDTLVCHKSKFKLPCSFIPAWTMPFGRIGVCLEQIANYDSVTMASILIHEVAHHYCPMLLGREDCAMSAQDACAEEIQ